MSKEQYLDGIRELIEEKTAEFSSNNVSVIERNTLPANGNYQQNCWYKIPDVICIFVDIRGSTRLSASVHDKSTASVYELFTGTAVKLFHEHGASYIDIKGDGVFALFNSDEVFKAFASAISFKTFASESFKKLVNAKAPDIDIGFHMGMDQKTILVKQVGIRDAEGRDSRKNEVWAGKTINMAAKLASKSKDDELWISDRFFGKLNNELILKSCGCENRAYTGEKKGLWNSVDVSEDANFDFKNAYILKSCWCVHHGKDWCQEILKLNEK